MHPELLRQIVMQRISEALAEAAEARLAKEARAAWLARSITSADSDSPSPMPSLRRVLRHGLFA